MGSKVGKVILPLVAIGGLAAMTGGFGLLGGGATAGAGATTAALGGTAATTAAGQAAQALALSGPLAGAPGTGIAAGGLSTAQASLGAATAAVESTIPWWQTAWTWVKGNKDIIGLGMSGLSAIGTMGAASQQAAFQENAIKLQEAQDSLALAEKERDNKSVCAGPGQPEQPAAAGSTPRGVRLAGRRRCEGSAERTVPVRPATRSGVLCVPPSPGQWIIPGPVPVPVAVRSRAGRWCNASTAARRRVPSYHKPRFAGRSGQPVTLYPVGCGARRRYGTDRRAWRYGAGSDQPAQWKKKRR